MKKFNYARIYENPRLAAYHDYFKRVLDTLFGYLAGLFGEHGFDAERYRGEGNICLLYTSPRPRDGLLSRMPSSA